MSSRVTTHTNRTERSVDNPELWELDPEFRPIETLSDLVESARRAASKIPPEERAEARRHIVAYLDEVAAREPSRLPAQHSE